MTFLQYVAKDLLAKHADELPHVAVVFPNKRASIFLNQALYHEAGHPVWSPAYITISDLFRSHSALQVPDNILLIFRLYNVYREVVQTDETLDHFYAWGRLLLADFDDLDKNLADADKVFANIEALKDLDDYSFLTPEQRKSIETFFGHAVADTVLKKRFHEIWRHLADIYHRYKESLRADNLAYEGMLYRDVAEQAANIQFRYSHYVFVGFNLLQRVEQTLFAQLQRLDCAEFYWDYDNAYMPPAQQEAGRYIAQYLAQFPNSLAEDRIAPGIGIDPDTIYNNLAEPKDITFLSAPTDNIQARYISEWLLENNRWQDGSRTAIVLADENLLQTVVHCLPPQVTDVNITTGFPLTASPATTFVGALIDLQLNGKTSGGKRFLLKYVNRVLRHPYAKFLSDEATVLCHNLNEHKQFFPTRQFLTEGRSEALALLFDDVSTQGPDLLSWVADILQRVGVGSAATNDPLMHEAVFRMYTLICRLNDLIVLAHPASDGQIPQGVDPQSNRQIVSIAILHKLLSQVLQATSIPFHGEPAKGVQIMGVLETRNLDFDHVLLLSCNEGKLPKGINDASFIPHALRAAHGLTTVENKVAIYAYYFYSLLQRAADATLAFNNATDDGQRGEMSRFMLQFMVENSGHHHLRRLNLQAGHSASLVVRQPVDKDEAIAQQLEQMQKISPTALYRYLRCPLQFYYHTVCKLYENDDIDESEMDPLTFGNIFHRTAELIYLHLSQESDRTIQASEIQAVAGNAPLLYRFIDQAFREKLFKVEDPTFKPKYNGLQLLNRQVVYKYIQRLLKLDAATAPFAIVALEQGVYDDLTFTTANGQSRTIQIGGYVDRLDRIENGEHHLRVIDYKTGSPTGSRPKSVANIFDPALVDNCHTDYYLQAFLYATLIRRGKQTMPKVNPQNLPVVPALLFIRDAQKEKYDPTLCFGTEKKGEKIPVNDILTYLDEFTDGIRQLLAEVCDPATPFTPTPYTERCKECPYNKICGI